jgi:1-deoxy-D-xylulose-5-phosphate synthase
MGKILESIHSPDDLKSMSDEDRLYLCDEIRSEIINTVSANGGHLASNLGVVELTVALLSVFTPEKDNIIWDVGHQCYAYKMLTGRMSEFHTLRQFGGISGFPSRYESNCDTFTTGHSSTSISSALGISSGKNILNKDGYTVAVIGDGSLTGGLAYEGLNNAGRLKRNFIVIINDNEMAISKNVGSMARHLGYIRTKPQYLKAKAGIENVISKIPHVGLRIAVRIRRFKNKIKRSIYNTTIFEDLGFEYYGPFDGHDLHLLIDTLRNARMINKPLVIHIRTIKGKGYYYAENNPDDFHGVPGFNIATGELPGVQECFSSKFGEYIVNLASVNRKICAVTAAMGAATGLLDFSLQYKDRYFDVGIAEGHAATFCGGLARSGMIPIFAVYSTFLQRSYDNLMHDISLQNLKVILAIDRAGFAGQDGRSHQGLYDISFLRSIPHITIFSPAYYSEMFDDFSDAVNGDYKLVAIRYPKGPEVKKGFNISEAHNYYSIYGNKDASNCFITFGRAFGEADEAVQILSKKGYDFCLVKLNKIYPISDDVFNLLMKYKLVISVEEGIKSGGISEYIGSELAEKNYIGKYVIRAVANDFIPHGKTDELLKLAGIDKDSLVNLALTEIFNRS